MYIATIILRWHEQGIWVRLLNVCQNQIKVLPPQYERYVRVWGTLLAMISFRHLSV